MSCWKTTAGEVSCQTGPGHRIVLKTSLRYLINKIKISVQGLLASFEHVGGRIEEDLNVFQNVFRTVGELRLGDSKKIQSNLIESDSSNPAQKVEAIKMNVTEVEDYIKF